LQYAQCSDSREATHTWWGGEGFPGAAGVLEGVIMVMIKFLRDFLRVHFGSSFEKTRLSQNYYQDGCVEKSCTKDIFEVYDVSCLENMSEWTTKAKRKVELGIFCAKSPRASCSIGRPASKLFDWKTSWQSRRWDQRTAI
jgi:hypothetical protein